LGKIKVKNLTYSYPDKDKPILSNINLNIEAGEFVLILGKSGCGKSSLLRAISRLIPDFYGGKIEGDVLIDNESIYKMKPAEISSKIGFIFQNPETQIIFSDVVKEIVFGMENLNLPYEKMKINLADVSSFLGITYLLDRKTEELSGGEKQKVSIASILSMETNILLLDEPTSQLDPISSENIISTIRRLNEDFGITVVMVEHRLDECFHLADRIIFIEDGYITFNDTPEAFLELELEKTIGYIPIVSEIFKKSNFDKIPKTVKEGKNILKAFINNKNKQTIEKEKTKKKLITSNNKGLITFENVYFSYSQDNKKNYALKNINLTIEKGNFVSIHGEIGAGKSTLLKLITLEKPIQSGKLFIDNLDSKKIQPSDIIGRIAYLSQNPSDYLSQDTVIKEIEFIKQHNKVDNEEITSILTRFGLIDKKDVHPRDLSTGERQRLAIASLLLSKPDLMLLDEPTRGLDQEGKKKLSEILIQINNQNTTIILITHDIEFAYKYAKKSIIMSRGEIIAFGDTRDVLGQSYSYTTEVIKLFRGIDDKIKNEEDAIKNLLEKFISSSY